LVAAAVAHKEVAQRMAVVAVVEGALLFMEQFLSLPAKP
jgi:hypoxanthine-guanine phosphoribosyltransferase